MTAPSTEKQRDYMRKIATKADRKLKAKQQGEQPVWRGLGMMGIIGWSVVTPVLIGLALGTWLDKCCSGGFNWTLNLLLIGLLLGCINASQWVIREHKAMHKDQGEKHD